MEFALHGTAVAPYVVKAIRRYLEEIDPSLAKVKINVVTQDDSATTASEVPADTLPRRP